MAEDGLDLWPCRVKTADGLSLAAWYTPPKNGFLILVAHGWRNARLIDIHRLFARNNYGVLSWDFRAHGESDGTICSAGYYEALDVEAALDFALSQRGIRQIGFWGGSMGGVAGLRAASRRKEIAALVLDCTPAEIVGATQLLARIPILSTCSRNVAQLVIGIKVSAIRPCDWITRLNQRPVFIIQGLADRVIPVDSAHRLFAAIRGPRRLWLESSAGHLDLYANNPEVYEQKVIEFFSSVLSQAICR